MKNKICDARLLDPERESFLVINTSNLLNIFSLIHHFLIFVKQPALETFYTLKKLEMRLTIKGYINLEKKTRKELTI